MSKIVSHYSNISSISLPHISVTVLLSHIPNLFPGIASAPEQTNMILQEYLNSFRQLSLGFLNHIGFSLAVEISSIQIPKVALTVSKKDKSK